MAAATLGVGSAPTFAQTFDLDGANVVLPAAPNFPNGYLSGSVNVTNSGAPAVLSEGGGTAETAIYSGAIADGAGTVGLTHTSGVTVLSGANTYSGATNVLAGSLLAGSSTGFSQNSLFTVASGATLDINGFGANVGGLAGAGTLTNNGAQANWLYISGAAATTFSGSVVDGANPVGLLNQGSGTLTLSGVNTNSLATYIYSGTIQAGSTTGLSPNAQVNLNNQGVLDINGFNSSVSGLAGYGGAVTNNGGSAATLTVDSSSSPTFYGAVQDGAAPLALTITGNGVQTLAGANAYSGLTTINSGATLQFGDGYSVGTFGAGNIVDNGTLSFNEGSNAGGQLTPLAANISGTGAVVQQGPGTVTMTGVNSFSGGVVVGPNSGAASASTQYQLLFGSPGALPTATAPGVDALTLINGGVAGTTYAIDQNFLNTVAIGSVGAVALGADSANNLNFDMAGLSNVSLGAASASCDGQFYCTTFNYSGTITASGDGGNNGVYQFGGGNAILNVASNLTDQYVSPYYNSRALVQGANGIGGYTILSGDNSYTNGTTVVSGILQFGQAGSATAENAVPQLGTPSITIDAYAVAAVGYALDQATLNSITPGSQGVIALAYTDPSANAGSTVLDFNTPGLANVSLGAVGAQTYYGTILPYVASSATGAPGTLGTFQLGGGPAGTTAFVSSLTVAAPLTDANASSANGAATSNQLIVNPDGVGAGGVETQAYANPITVYLTNNETYSGGTFVQGGTLALGNGTLNGNLLNTSSVQLQNFSTLSFQEGAGPVTFNQVIGGDGFVVQQGPGQVTLTRAETYAASSVNSGYANGGGTYIYGGALALGPSASIASSSYVVMYDNGNASTFDISGGGNQTIQYLFGTQNTTVALGANTLTLGVAGGSWLSAGYYAANPNNSNGVEPYFLGSITGTGGVVFQLPQGQTPYVFGGSSSYSGATTIASGTVQAGGANALSPNSAVGVAGGATLDLGGYSQTIASLSGAGTLTNSVTAPATLTLGADNSSPTFSGLISDAGANGALTLDKVGSGTFTLSGANNSYTGGTLLQAGAIVAGNAGALGSGALTISPGATLQFGGSLSLANAIVLNGAGLQTIDNGGQTITLAGVISGAGTLDAIGAGELVLSGVNSYSGGTLLNAGALVVGNAGALGTGALTISPGATLQFGGSLSLANAIVLNGAGLQTIDNGGRTITLAGVISGAGSLDAIGAGELFLPVANSYTGGTTLAAGTLGLGATGALGPLGAGGLTMSPGTGLQFTAADVAVTNSIELAGAGLFSFDTGANQAILSGQISGTGALQKLGSGTLAVLSSNSFSGGADVLAGALLIGNSSSLGTGALTLSDGATLESFNTNLSVDNAVTLLQGNPNIDTEFSTLTLTGVVSGAGALNKIGTGALTLTNANTFSGGVNVQAGTLGVGNASALGAGPVNLSGGSTLQILAPNLNIANAVGLVGGAATVDTGANTATVSGQVSGAGGLDKIGSGELILTGANAYSGGTALAAGTLGIGANSALGSGALTMSAGTELQFTAANLNLTNNVALAGTGLYLFDTGNYSEALSGVISGTGTLDKLGGGTLTLNGANTFSGGVDVVAGTLAVGNVSALGTGAVLLSEGATLEVVADGQNVANVVTLVAGAPDIDTGANTLTVSGVISGANTLVKTGSGELILTGANSYSGGSTLSQGTLGLGASSALGTGALTMSSGTGLQFTAANLNVGNAIALAGSGAFQFDTGAQTETLSGVISGPGALQKIGSGTLILTNVNAFTGGANVLAGTLAIGNAAALGAGGVSLSDGATLQSQVANLTLANAVTLLQGNANIDTLANTATIAGLVSGAGGLDKLGAGDLMLTGNETYSGGTIVQSGVLALGNATLDGNLVNSPSVQLQNGATLSFQEGAGAISFNAVISGAGNVVQAGPGAVTLTQVESYSGGTTITGGGLALGANASIASSAFLALQSSGASFDISGAGNQTVQYLFGAANTGVALGANTLTIGGVAGESWLSSAQSGNPNNSHGVEPYFLGSITGSGGVVLQLPQGAGQSAYVLGGSNSYSGATVIASGTLQAGGANALSPNSSVNVQSGATLDLGGYNQTIASLSGAGTLTNSFAAAATLTLGGDNASTSFSGPVSDAGASGALTLDKIGTGAFTLSGANTFVGGVLLQAGALVVGNAQALGSGALTISAGATLQAGGSLSLANAIVLSGSGLQTFDTGAQTLALTGAISGPGTLSKIGSGELMLAGANSFTGGTTLGAGTLGVGSSGALGAGALTMTAGASLQFTAANVGLSNNVALNGTGLYTFDTGGNAATLSGVVSGAGALQKIGAGTLALSSANSFSGGADVVAGTLAIGNAGALGSGPLSLSDGATLQIVADGLSIGNAVALLGTADPTIDTGANNVTLSGSITGQGALTKLGTGALTLTANNSYTGDTNVNAGALEVDGSIASSPLTSVAANASLRGIGAVGGVSVSAGGTLAPGNAASPYGTLTTTGAITLAAASTYAINLSPGAVSLLSVNRTANVAGAVAVNAQPGSYSPTTKYDILTAAGGVSGTFGSVTLAGLPGYSGILTYDPDNVYLQVVAGSPVGSIHDLAVTRESQMVTARILGSVLLGANEQINCSTCVSGFASVGSLALGTHGRWSLSDRLTLLAGLSFDEFSADGVKVTSAPLVAASLRYDLVDWGRSRPFFEAGGLVAPYEASTYTRSYSFGGGTATGSGSAISHGASAFARVGWVWRPSPVDEAAVYGDIDRNWQQTSAYSETTGILNPQPANFAGGLDTFNIARIGAQYTHLFGKSLEVNANVAVAHGFGAQIGTDADVTGFGLVPNTGIASTTWVEFGARAGYRVSDRFTIDAFLLGTAGAQPAGETLHGGLGVRYAF